MPLTEQQFLEFEGNIQKVWQSYFKAEKDYIPMIFNKTSSSGARELHRSIGAFGMMTDWNGQVAYDRFEKGYEKEYRHGKKTTGVAVDADLFEDKEYASIKAHVENVSYGVHKTLQRDAASVFNNAFDSTILGPDGVPLCSSSHHMVPGDDVQGNTDTLDMTVDNLQTVLNRMVDFADDRGDIMEVQGDTIICGTHWAKTVTQIVGSDKEAYTGENQKNVHSGLSYMIIPRIRGKKWFVASKRLMKGGNGFNWFMRKDPRNLQRDSDFDAEILKWKAVGRWSYGWNTWAFIYGNNPA
jgi:hypothetical protein